MKEGNSHEGRELGKRNTPYYIYKGRKEGRKGLKPEAGRDKEDGGDGGNTGIFRGIAGNMQISRIAANRLPKKQ